MSDRLTDEDLDHLRRVGTTTGEWLDRLLEEVAASRAERWECQSCGCTFPRLPDGRDADIRRCSKCVEVEALRAELAAAHAFIANNEGEAIAHAAGRRTGLEEAAKLCDELTNGWTRFADDCAPAIRRRLAEGQG